MDLKRGKLQWQLTTYIGGAVCALVLCFLVVDYARQRETMINDLTSHMRQQMHLLQVSLNTERDPAVRRKLVLDYCKQMKYHGKPGHELIVIDKNKNLIAANEGSDLQRFLREVDLKRILSGERYYLTARAMHGERNVVTITMPFFEGRTGPRTVSGVIHYAETLVGVDRLSRRLLINRSARAAFMLIVVMMAVWLVVRYKVVKPLDALFLHEYFVSKGELSRRDYPDPNNEISQIYDMFNQMVERLAQHEHKLLRAQTSIVHSQFAMRAHAEVGYIVSDVIDRAQNVLLDDAAVVGRTRRELETILQQSYRIKKLLSKYAFEKIDEVDVEGAKSLLAAKEDELEASDAIASDRGIVAPESQKVVN